MQHERKHINELLARLLQPSETAEAARGTDSFYHTYLGCAIGCLATWSVIVIMSGKSAHNPVTCSTSWAPVKRVPKTFLENIQHMVDNYECKYP